MSDFSGKWLQRVPKSLHDKSVKAAEKDGVSLNHWVSNAIALRLGENHLVPKDRLESIAQDDFCEFACCSSDEPQSAQCYACDAIYAARECLKLRAELTSLKSENLELKKLAPRWREQLKGSTHWDTCWQDHRHCALMKITDLEEELTSLRERVKELGARTNVK